MPNPHLEGLSVEGMKNWTSAFGLFRHHAQSQLDGIDKTFAAEYPQFGELTKRKTHPKTQQCEAMFSCVPENQAQGSVQTH